MERACLWGLCYDNGEYFLLTSAGIKRSMRGEKEMKRRGKMKFNEIAVLDLGFGLDEELIPSLNDSTNTNNNNAQGCSCSCSTDKKNTWWIFW